FGALEGLGSGEVDGQLLEVGAVVDGRDRGEGQGLEGLADVELAVGVEEGEAVRREAGAAAVGVAENSGGALDADVQATQGVIGAGRRRRRGWRGRGR
ncbi:hypothetical protein EBR16_08750, partial [bacterium]|nr:hypothetical protein [bacterium]